MKPVKIVLTLNLALFGFLALLPLVFGRAPLTTAYAGAPHRPVILTATLAPLMPSITPPLTSTAVLTFTPTPEALTGTAAPFLTATLTLTTISPTPALTATVSISSSPMLIEPVATPVVSTVPLTTGTMLISEFLYDGLIPSTEGDEFIEVCNAGPGPVNLSGYKIGDAEMQGDGEGMYQLPLSTTLAVDSCWVVAKNAGQFYTRFAAWPDAELVVGSSQYTDNPAVPNLAKYTPWSAGSWALANNADELILLGPEDTIVDSVAYRNGAYELLGLEPSASAPEPHSLQRVWAVDTDSMPHDFVSAQPNPGQPTLFGYPVVTPPSPAELADGMKAFWGHLHAHTTYSDGAGPPHYALAQARAAGLHFYGITDHGWWLSNLEWTQTLSQTRQATVPGEFVALRGIEWTHQMAGHINVFNTDTLIQRTNPIFADLSEFYTWLAANPEVIAQFNHPDPAYGGTFYNFLYHPAAAQVVYLQEIGNAAQGYKTYEPSFVQSNMTGWRTSPVNNSDTHNAGWGFDIPARTGLVAPALTETDLLAAMRARRTFATEDSNLAVGLHSGSVWMGSELSVTGPLTLTVTVIDADLEPFTLELYDGNLPLSLRSFTPTTAAQDWQTTVAARPGHFFWVKVIQIDGDQAYSAPIWLAGELTPETIVLNEVLPAPGDVDWDGDGTAGHQDEWLELYNPNDRPVGLGGWRLADTSNLSYDIPLGIVMPPQGFVTFYQRELGFSLNNDGDTITLIHPRGAVVDRFTYDHSPGYDDTWCRLPDGADPWRDTCGASPNASNWEKVLVYEGPLSVNIYEAKRLTYDAWVKISGHVTAPPELLGSRVMYIQDETAGIRIYLPKDHRHLFTLGDKVEVVGNLRRYYHEAQITVKERGDVKLIRAGQPPPPLPIVTTSLLEPYEGLLVQLQGQAVRFRGSTRFWIDDGTDPAQVYIRRSTGIRKPFIEAGTPLTVVGVVSQYSEGEPTRADYRLLLRYQSDLILPGPTPAPAPVRPADPWPSLLPETGENTMKGMKKK